MNPEQQNPQPTEPTQPAPNQAPSRPQEPKAPTTIILQRVVWFIAGVIIALLALRVVLLLLAANRDAGFVDFIYGLSSFFASPFYGIFNYEPAYGQSVFELSSIVAIVVYALVAWGLAKLFTLTKSHPEA